MRADAEKESSMAALKSVLHQKDADIRSALKREAEKDDVLSRLCIEVKYFHKVQHILHFDRPC